MQQHLFNNICTSGRAGFLDDVSITFIDKADPSGPLRREDFWRRTLKTMEPFGFDIEERGSRYLHLHLIFFAYNGVCWHIFCFLCSNR